MKKIPLVKAKVRLEADFDGDGGKPPGFELDIDATYRDLPYVALIALEGGVVNLMNEMKEHGEVLARQNGSLDA